MPHPEHVHPGYMIADKLSDLQLVFMEEPGGRPCGGNQIQDLFLYSRIIAAQNGGTAGLQEIDMPVSILIIEIGTFGPVKNNGVRIVKGQVVLDATRDYFFCLFDNCFGGSIFFFKSLQV